MQIIAESLQRAAELFLHAGYLSAAVSRTLLPPPTPEMVARMRNPGITDFTLTAADLRVLAVAVVVVAVVVLLASLRGRQINRRLQQDLERGWTVAQGGPGARYGPAGGGRSGAVPWRR